MSINVVVADAPLLGRSRFNEEIALQSKRQAQIADQKEALGLLRSAQQEELMLQMEEIKRQATTLQCFERQLNKYKSHN